MDLLGESLLGFIMIFWGEFGVAFGVAESPEGDSLHACPARGYFSVKKSNQKSLGEDPETPDASEPSRPETLRIPGAG